MSDYMLYHYSDKNFINPKLGLFELMSRERQGIVTKEERQKAIERAKQTLYPGPYTEHISFFIDPIPSKIIAGIFNNQHPFWKKGTRLFEYCVPLTDIDLKDYVFVETPEGIKHFYAISEDFSLETYYKELYSIRVRNHEIGNSKSDFKKAYDKLKGSTESSYRLLPSRPNFEEIKDKYAATVPHVMLYPKHGLITGSKMNQLTIGSDKREEVIINRSSKVISNW